jgi:hypothetical protein
MQYRLRTLMIVLALGPMVLAGALYEAACIVVRIQPTQCPKYVPHWDADIDWDGGPPGAVWIDPDRAGRDNRP